MKIKELIDEFDRMLDNDMVSEHLYYHEHWYSRLYATLLAIVEKNPKAELSPAMVVMIVNSIGRLMRTDFTTTHDLPLFNPDRIFDELINNGDN